jgi:hypothetical protein
MSPDLKSVDNQDISNHPKTIHTSKNINHFTIFSMVPFLPNLYGNKFKADGCNQGFCTGFISIASPLNGHQFF